MAKMMTGRDLATPFSVLHAAMLLGQKTRLAKFREAINQVVRTNDYVVDIGTGSGVLAIMAAKAGARKVFAIDINKESLQYARHAAELNCVDDNIQFVENHFSEFIPDDKADVVICEMLSSILLVEQQVPASLHAINNILKQGGVIIPEKATVFAVPVECPIMAERFEFEDLTFPKVVQTVNSDLERDLADIQVLHEFDFREPPNNLEINRVLTFHMISDGILHGLVGLFEAQLYGNIKLDMEDGWKQLFLPLENPLSVEEGDEVRIRISYTPGDYNSLVVELL
ncbi:MAG: 50S ribosomal protein L11 methyltransferase [Promethearchaeota archaeon]